MRRIAALLAALHLAACAAVAHEPAAPPVAPAAPLRAEADLLARDGAPIGKVLITEGPKGVVIRIEAKAGALSPGWHGAHFHQTGTCGDHAAGFTASGGHVGKAENQPHGLLNPNGPEAGDLTNIFAPDPAAGTFGAELFSPFVTLRADAPGGRMALRDADGAALVIHAGPDDHMSQPIGGAGARVACAVIPPQG